MVQELKTPIQSVDQEKDNASEVFDTFEVVPPDIDGLTIDDDNPVDNLPSAKQQRLLVDVLYSSEPLPQPFLADANIGLFYGIKQPPVVPDFFLSLGVTMPEDWSKKENRTYFVWEFGKAPEVVVEIISNRKGHELESKFDDYARLGISYYVVFDPLKQLQASSQMNGQLLKIFGLVEGRYQALTTPFWLASVGIGLTLWDGVFESASGTWLRWCDPAGVVIPTGAEKAALAESARQEAESARQEAESARQEAEEKATRLAQKLRALGIDPESV